MMVGGLATLPSLVLTSLLVSSSHLWSEIFPKNSTTANLSSCRITTWVSSLLLLSLLVLVWTICRLPFVLSWDFPFGSVSLSPFSFSSAPLFSALSKAKNPVLSNPLWASLLVDLVVVAIALPIVSTIKSLHSFNTIKISKFNLKKKKEYMLQKKMREILLLEIDAWLKLSGTLVKLRSE